MKAPVKHADETGVRIKGKTQWLHVLSHGQATHYRVTEKRGALVEDMEGILIHELETLLYLTKGEARTL